MPLLNFRKTLAALIVETGEDNWDGESGTAIPVGDWGEVCVVVECVHERLPDLPEPHPSAGGDGSRHLRWSSPGRLFDVEIDRVQVLWSRRIDGVVTAGTCKGDMVALLAETFSLKDVEG